MCRYGRIISDGNISFLCFCCISRCKMDPTIRTYSTNHSRQLRFSMEAFKFIGQHDQVRTLCEFYPQMHR